MRFLLLLMILIVLPTGLMAQPDFGGKALPSGSGLKIPSSGSSSSTSSPSSSSSLPLSETPSSIFKPKSTTTIPEKEPNSNFGVQKKFANPNASVEQKLNNTDYSGEGKVLDSKRNQYLGDVRTKSGLVRILYRDYSAVDGDIVRVFYDNNIYVKAAVLGSGFDGVDIVLHKGNNYIDFQALNEGSSPPNTAEFEIWDDKGVRIYSNRWDIGTGYKATVIVIQE